VTKAASTNLGDRARPRMATVRADPIAYLVASWRPGATRPWPRVVELVAGLRPIGIVELRGEVERRQRLSSSYRASSLSGVLVGAVTASATGRWARLKCAAHQTAGGSTTTHPSPGRRAGAKPTSAAGASRRAPNAPASERSPPAGYQVPNQAGVVFAPDGPATPFCWTAGSDRRGPRPTARGHGDRRTDRHRHPRGQTTTGPGIAEPTRAPGPARKRRGTLSLRRGRCK